MTTDIQDLSDLAWRAVAARRDVKNGRAVRRPALEPLEQARQASRFDDDLAVLGRLEDTLELAQKHELGHLASGLRAVLDQVRWSQNPSYDATNCSRELLDGYAYAGLSGPDGPLACETPLAGFLLLGTRVTYPDHKHAPSEIYLVLTPGSQWSLASGEWFDVAPGDLIRHDPWQIHATRTTEQPFLAFVAWLERGHRARIEI